MFPRHHLHHPLRESQMQKILRPTRCRLLYRFDHVHVIDAAGKEYHVCHRQHLATLTTHQFMVAVTKALSTRLQ